MKHKNSQSGFTLVEMSIVLLILGMITGAFFAFLTPMQDLKRREATKENQEKVVRALANFAQQNGRLPCPSDPNPGTPSELGQERSGGCGATAALRDGVVPFKILGLSELDALDGWKRPFTYIVDEKAKESPTNTVHAQCRNTTTTPPWISGGFNANPNKAAFCCQQNSAAGRLLVFNKATMNDPADLVVTLTGVASDFATNNTTAGNTPANLAYLAFVLISHGKNGMGAYALRQTGGHSNMPAAGSDEEENANMDASVLDLPLNNTPDNTYFDDIVVWRTQQGLISEFGNDSCALP